MQVDSQLFSELYLKDILNYLNECLKKERMTSLVLLVTGELALVLKDKNLSFITVTLDYITNFLQARTRKKIIPVPPEMLKCLGMFARAFGSDISSRIRSIIRKNVIVSWSLTIERFSHYQ